MSDLHFVSTAEARLRKMNAERGIWAVNDYGFRVELLKYLRPNDTRPLSERPCFWRNFNDPRVFGADFKRDTGGEFPQCGPIGRNDAERVIAWLDSFSD